jgi:CelD/BcsL family acetyltransferase involved in cellulose biosynthesis
MPPSMQIEAITDLARLDALRTDYEAVYAADPHASVFLSWAWLRGWFNQAPFPWVLLGAKAASGSPYVGFLPLITRGPQVLGVQPIRFLYVGGRPHTWYTGFVCLPTLEKPVLQALADHIQHQMAWDRLHLDYVYDPRLDTFIEYFSAEDFAIQVTESIPSMHILLPTSWDAYKVECLGSSTRQALLRDTRRIERREGLQLTRARPDNIESQLDALFGLWQQRWGPQPLVTHERNILRYCVVHDMLWLHVLWDGARPVAAVAGIIDRVRQTYYSYITTYDKQYAKLTPGRVLIGYHIRCAIENGIRVYDLLMGPAAYKFAFGAQQLSTRNAVITRRNLHGTIASMLVRMRARLTRPRWSGLKTSVQRRRHE